MLLRTIYDEHLAQAAYLIGCPASGDAIVIDPERDVDRYLALARSKGLRLVGAAETHVHADFLSGVRQLAHVHGVTAYVSGEGDEAWRARWPEDGPYHHRLLHDGDVFRVGSVEILAWHTPGHTPEHLSYVITDRGSGASDPMGIVTGDFAFVGDVGRPDLFETAVGHADTAEPSARSLHGSARALLEMPDFLQIWPGHGAGSSCGKALDAVPSTTIGYERRTSPALSAAAAGEDAFVAHVLAGQPEPPRYFARMKRENRDGPAILDAIPSPAHASVEALAAASATGEPIVLDTRPWDAFTGGHLSRSLSIPLGPFFVAAAASYIDPAARVVIVADRPRVELIVRLLVRVGIDHVEGFVPPEDLARLSAGALATIDDVDVHDATRRARAGALVLDVRSPAEHAAGCIAGSSNVAHTRLPDRLDAVPRDRDVLVHCQGGVRSAIAASLLAREGFRVTNVAGGMAAWRTAGLP